MIKCIKIKLLIFGSCLLFFTSNINANSNLDIKARSAILQDFLSGEILYEKDADISIYPASMTKIMTSIIAFDLLRKGEIKLDDKFVVSENAWRLSTAGYSSMFIMIGDETDGTVIPQDLGLDWALSKKKDDYIGKRAHQRSNMSNPERWKLVGLESTDGSVIPEGAYAIGLGENEVGQKVTIGRVTSTYYSPSLKKGIALGLVAHGPDRLGEIIQFPTLTNSIVEAKIVSPVFYDPDGLKQNV